MTRPPKIPSPFKLLSGDGTNTEFEAVFDLPNDGCSNNQLIVRVTMEITDSDVCDVTILGRTHRDTVIGTFTTRITSLGNVLYGFASIKQVPQLVFN